jgi:hypothetical protein
MYHNDVIFRALTAMDISSIIVWNITLCNRLTTPCLFPDSSTLNMEAICRFETSVPVNIQRATRLYVSEDITVHIMIFSGMDFLSYVLNSFLKMDATNSSETLIYVS